MSCLERRGVCRLEAAVKSFLLTITGTLLCAAAPQSVSADSAVPLQTERNGQLRATRTNMPDIIDMSYADPAMWHRLPRTAPVYDEFLSHAPAFEDFEVRQFSPTVALRNRPNRDAGVSPSVRARAPARHTRLC